MVTDITKYSRNEFINNNKNFIYKVACGICKRKLNFENDDELAIAMIAFNKACDTYNEKKGNFFSYATVVIRNTLIDYFRKSQNAPLLVFESDSEMDYIDYKNSMANYEINIDNKMRAHEINSLANELSKYGIGFSWLVSHSPKHRDTRDTLLNISLFCIRDNELLSRIKAKKILPVKELTVKLDINRKIFDKWRRYIIALIVVLSGDYPYIKSYLNIKVGGKNE